jgi:hypothetical protein
LTHHSFDEFESRAVRKHEQPWARQPLLRQSVLRTRKRGQTAACQHNGEATETTWQRCVSAHHLGTLSIAWDNVRSPPHAVGKGSLTCCEGTGDGGLEHLHTKISQIRESGTCERVGQQFWHQQANKQNLPSMKSHCRILAAFAFAVGMAAANSGWPIIRLTDDQGLKKGAVCLDGTNPAMFLGPWNKSTDATKWVLYIKGGRPSCSNDKPGCKAWTCTTCHRIAIITLLSRTVISCASHDVSANSHNLAMEKASSAHNQYSPLRNVLVLCTPTPTRLHNQAAGVTMKNLATNGASLRLDRQTLSTSTTATRSVGLLRTTQRSTH